MPPPAPLRTIWARIFTSPDEPRLRAGWRLAAQTAAFFLLLIAASIPAAVMLLFVPLDSEVLVLLSGIGELLAVTLSVFLARRFLDHRSVVSLGLRLDRWALFDVLAGIVITFVMMAGIYLAMSLLGWIRFEGFAWTAQPPQAVLAGGLAAFLAFVLVGWSEELLSRGYHLQTLASGTNLHWGVAISSTIFGVLHILNPAASWISTLGIVLAGLFLASGYLGTRQLWLPIGLHIGWNFFEGPVFGFPVSGLDFFHLIRIEVTGPQLWTGGAFGPEAGLIVVPALAVGGLLVWAYSQARRRHVRDAAPASIERFDRPGAG
jgi:membrane protease YdiL (CAAX protease family)